MSEKKAVRTKEERRQAGKALRDACSRGSHGKVVLGQGAERDPVAIIEASNEDRMANLVPIRHGRMLQSAFAFFRGTAAVQAHDLAGTPSSGIVVQACGDCHLMNFGGFATPERNLVFDINDFDETLPAPFEWDIKRLAASFVVAARWRGFKEDEAREMAVTVAAAYRETMNERIDLGVLESWYSKLTFEDVRDEFGELEEVGKRIDKLQATAESRTHETVFNKLTTPDEGLARIVDQPPLLYHVDKRVVNAGIVAEFFKDYRKTLAEERRVLFDRFTYVDTALKVVGVGSVGTRCFVALLFAAPDDPLFLQIKEARASVLAPWVGGHRASHNGQRVVIGQRLMQSASDIFLGWSRGPQGRDYYIRQLRDMKVAPMVETQSPSLMRVFATLCGRVLARSHDKAGDAAMIAGYLGSNDKFDEAIGDYAVAYADQVERDYEAFVKAVRAGKVKTDLSHSDIQTVLR